MCAVLCGWHYLQCLHSDMKDVTRLEQAMECFQANCMKLNEEKCLLITWHKHEFLWANIGRNKIRERQKQNLFVILIEEFTFWWMYFVTFQKPCQEAKRVCKNLQIHGNCMPKKAFMKAFLESQFGCCPLGWMCCDRSCNNRINHLYERALRIVYNDNVTSFEELWQRDQSVSIYHRNIRLLGIQIYKTRNNISSHIMNELFEQWDISYNLRSQTDFKTGPISTVNNGLKSLRYFGPKIGT